MALATRLTAALLALCVLSSCGSDQAGSDLPPPDLNVVLIVVDTMGARYLGCQTPGLTNSPVIDRLAAEGAQFTRTYSTAPWTQPAVASLMTSRVPSVHGVRRIFDGLDRRWQTLAEHLKGRGYRTAGVISHFVIGDEFGFGQGFDHYDDSPVGNHRAVTSHKVTDQAITSVDRLGDAPFFLFVHYFDPHWYFNHHPDFDQTGDYRGDLLPGMEIGELRALRDQLDAADIAYLEGLYREEIAYTDHHLGRLLDHLRARGLAENTLVIVTADHGEEFMQHGWIGHTATLHDELIHVPLIFHAPDRIAPRRIDTPVSILDITPTILDLVGRPAADPDWQGASLAATLAAGTPPPDRPLFAEVSYVSPSGWPSGDGHVKRYFKTALVQGHRKLIHDHIAGSWSYFDLAADPLERTDRWDPDDPVQRALLDQLHAWDLAHTATWFEEMQQQADLDAEAVKRLRSLGYVH
jgi:arylsulfatase A-like enzyme